MFKPYPLALRAHSLRTRPRNQACRMFKPYPLALRGLVRRISRRPRGVGCLSPIRRHCESCSPRQMPSRKPRRMFKPYPQALRERSDPMNTDPEELSDV